MSRYDEAKCAEGPSNYVGSALGFSNLDERIKNTQDRIERFESELKVAKAELAEYQKIRKLVSSEDEGKILALKRVGLI